MLSIAKNLATQSEKPRYNQKPLKRLSCFNYFPEEPKEFDENKIMKKNKQHWVPKVVTESFFDDIQEIINLVG